MKMMMTSNSKKASSNANTTASSHQHPEAMGMAPHVMDAMNMMHTQPHAAVSGSGERKPRPQLDEALKCPRCDSNNTKFCYYNNNKMSQPRYFCKACRRYWTHGGSLRNVPVGGGCRKNKRSSASLLPSSSSNSISEQLQQHVVPDAMIVDQLQDFSNVLPTFMSTSFELPKTHLQPFASFSLPSLAPTPPLDFDDGIMTSSFPDILRGGFPDHQSNSFYEPTSSGMEIPSSVGCDVAMQIDTISIDGDGANATTHQGEQWPTIQVDPINQQEGASVPDTAKDK